MKESSMWESGREQSGLSPVICVFTMMAAACNVEGAINGSRARCSRGGTVAIGFIVGAGTVMVVVPVAVVQHRSCRKSSSKNPASR